MRYRITGVRLGTLVHVGGLGVAKNGEITEEQRDALEQDYDLEPCAGIPPATMSPEDLVDMRAANAMLGVDTLEDGRTRIEHDKAKGMAELLAPMRKKTYRDQFSR